MANVQEPAYLHCFNAVNWATMAVICWRITVRVRM